MMMSVIMLNSVLVLLRYGNFGNTCFKLSVRSDPLKGLLRSPKRDDGNIIMDLRQVCCED